MCLSYLYAPNKNVIDSFDSLLLQQFGQKRVYFIDTTCSMHVIANCNIRLIFYVQWQPTVINQSLFLSFLDYSIYIYIYIYIYISYISIYPIHMYVYVLFPIHLQRLLPWQILAIQMLHCVSQTYSTS